MLFIPAGVLAASIIYELVMNEPATGIPARINRILEKSGPSESTNPHDYVAPEKRYNLPETQ